MNYFDSNMSKSTITVVYFGRRQFIITFADNYSGKFEHVQTIIHQHVHLGDGKVSHMHRRVC